MARKEAVFTRRLLAHLRELPYSWWERIEQSAIRGTPDVLGVVNGLFVAIEAKTDKGRLSELQRYKLGKINEAGGLGLSVTEAELQEAMEIIKLCSQKLKK